MRSIKSGGSRRDVKRYGRAKADDEADVMWFGSKCMEASSNYLVAFPGCNVT